MTEGKDPPGTLDIFVPNGAADRGFMDLQLLGDVGQAQGVVAKGRFDYEVRYSRTWASSDWVRRLR